MRSSSRRKPPRRSSCMLPMRVRWLARPEEWHRHTASLPWRPASARTSSSAELLEDLPAPERPAGSLAFVGCEDQACRQRLQGPDDGAR
eukprot:8550110-Pyramimonas_sp.AAC.2